MCAGRCNDGIPFYTERFGSIGGGRIGATHAKAARQDCGSRLVAVTDTETDCASALASAFNAAQENGWNALIRRDDTDAIILSTPPTAHAEIAIAAMRAGKHVFCEKPLAKTAEECRRMIRTPETTRRVLAAGFNFRFFDSVAKARELFDSGAIGEVNHIASNAGYDACTVQGFQLVASRRHRWRRRAPRPRDTSH